MTNCKNRIFEIDLLYLEKDGNNHYCLIKDLNSLFSINGNRAYVCRNCTIIFTSVETLRNHQEICIKHNYFKVKMPENRILKFEKHHFKSRLPVAIYADFEAKNIKLKTASPSNRQSYNIRISKQEIISYDIYIKSDYSNLITSQYDTYTGYDATEKFVETIIRIYDNISNKLNNYSKANQRVKLTKTQQQEFNQATHCYICKREFNNDPTQEVITKIREHNHFNRKYRGAACQSCNTIEGKVSKIIPVFFHNGSGCDFHFIVTKLLKYKNQYNKVEVLSKTSEEYISIIYGSFYRKLVFLDSYRFLQDKLSSIAKSLDSKDLKILGK